MLLGAVQRLDEYIAGGNEDKEQLACTLPVMAVYPLEEHPHKGTRQNYTVAIFLPYDKQVGGNFACLCWI